MNHIQREKIVQLREAGLSYAGIAQTLALSENTVKSYCQRNNLGGCLKVSPSDDEVSQAHCTNCGTSFNQMAGYRAKKYCSSKCRMAWWNSILLRLKKIRQGIHLPGMWTELCQRLASANANIAHFPAMANQGQGSHEQGTGSHPSTLLAIATFRNWLERESSQNRNFTKSIRWPQQDTVCQRQYLSMKRLDINALLE